MPLIDISPRVHPGIGVWPGDVPYSAEKAMDIHGGAHMDLGSMRTTFHVGAHADSHRHYAADGPDAAQMPLDAYYGPCQVVDVEVARGQRFGMEHLGQEPDSPRILFRTNTFVDPDDWNTDFAAPDPALIDVLADRGTVLVGFDTPSTDLFDSKDLPAHKRLAARGICNLEGLLLKDVAPGQYMLIALPLRLAGADASPVRAALATL